MKNIAKQSSYVYITGLAVGTNIPDGGNWYVGQEETEDGVNSPNPFKGEVTNVNVFGNFDADNFQNEVGYRVTRTTCRASIFSNIIKSWNDFKIGVVGKPKIISKSFCRRV